MLLVVVVLLLPEGLVGIFDKVRRHVAALRGRSPDDTPGAPDLGGPSAGAGREGGA